MAMIPVAPGEIATIVTTLEHRQRPRPAPLPETPLRLVRWHTPDLDHYRALFRRVGAPWLWYSRLAMRDSALAAVIHREQTQVHAVIDRAGIEVGLLEFTHPAPDWCSLDYFGLVHELTGKAHGRWLMAIGLAMMWRPAVTFVRVNTCTLDHPSALGFYRSAGFVPVSQAIETFPDPRLLGLIECSAAPHVPLFAAS
ncbi:MAG: GNAT family N-acetyltransferase [Sphingomonas sp.]|nr:GNAT family N-acetyltransferase [Sphingomonas sp.]